MVPLKEYDSFKANDIFQGTTVVLHVHKVK